MKNRVTTSLVICLLVACCTTAAAPPREPATLLFTNGTIYTADDRKPRAQAVAVRGDRIVYVGDVAGAKSFADASTKIVDLRGRTLVPGFTDAHCHIIGIGLREMTLNLEGTASLDGLLSKLKARVERASPGEWITGRGWIETHWKPPAFPTRSDLDRVSPNNPVFLVRSDGHAAVVNSKALEIAGVTRSTENPFGGEIMREKATGEASGMLLDNAMPLVRKHVPTPTAADYERAVDLAVARSLSLGWTQLQNAGSTYADHELYSKLFAEGRIKLRIYNAVYGPTPDAQRLLREGPVVGRFGNRYTMRTIKVSFDGALGSTGAALLAPYADHDTSGFLKYKDEELLPMFAEALRRGIQLETHAIGDLANRRILDLYAQSFKLISPAERSVREPRWRVEHAQVLDAADVPRFAALGVIPSMQPSHAIGDLHFAPSRLGLKRLAGAYAWQSLIKAGSIIPGGSDAPVERGEPMIEFYAAVARRDLKGFSGEGWHPEQALRREQALKMFTLWPAVAAFEESIRGSIEPGKLADFTVFSADIMQVPAPQLLETRCLMTVVGGEIVYEEKIQK